MATKKVKEVEVETEFDEYEDLSLEDRVVNIEKKVNWTFGLTVVITILLVLILIFVLAGDTSTKTNTDSDDETQETTSADYDVSAFKEISAQDIKKASKGKSILIYVGRSSCGYCVQYVPILKEIQEKYNSYTTYYIDIAKILDFSGTGGILDEEADEIMLNLDKDFMDSNWGATPLTLLVKDSKLVDSIVGYVDASSLETFVKTNKLAK